MTIITIRFGGLAHIRCDEQRGFSMRVVLHLAAPSLVIAMNWTRINTSISMKANMGSADRLLRLLLAAVFAVLYFTGTVAGTFGLVLLALGAIFLLTSAIGFCPLYAPFGISTCATKGKA